MYRTIGELLPYFARFGWTDIQLEFHQCVKKRVSIETKIWVIKRGNILITSKEGVENHCQEMVVPDVFFLSSIRKSQTNKINE